MTYIRKSNRVKTAAGGYGFTDDVYHARWMQRVLSKITVTEKGCWRWQGFKGHTGYAQIPYRGQSINGHRTMYRVHYGVELKTEQYVLHRCDIRDCLNPAHLWIGTAKDNNIDCAKKGRHYEATRTECPKGHPYDEENTRWLPTKKPGGFARECKACTKLRMQTPAYRARANERQRLRRAQKRLALRGDSHV